MLGQRRSQSAQDQRAILGGHLDQVQNTAVTAFNVALPIDAHQARLGGWSGRLREDACLLNDPALIAHVGVGARKRRRHRAHQIVDLLSRPGPIDPPILRPATSKVLTRLR